MPTVRLAKRRRGEGVVAFARPSSVAQIALGAGELADRHEEEPEGGVGDLFGQDVRRVGDDDAALGGGGEVDAVIADAEAGDDLEPRQPPDQVAADADMGAAGDAADGVGALGDQRVDVLGGRRLARHEQPRQRRIGRGGQVAGRQDLDLLHLVIFPESIRQGQDPWSSSPAGTSRTAADPFAVENVEAAGNDDRGAGQGHGIGQLRRKTGSRRRPSR